MTTGYLRAKPAILPMLQSYRSARAKARQARLALVLSWMPVLVTVLVPVLVTATGRTATVGRRCWGRPR
jgi:hypothetical protein